MSGRGLPGGSLVRCTTDPDRYGGPPELGYKILHRGGFARDLRRDWNFITIPSQESGQEVTVEHRVKVENLQFWKRRDDGYRDKVKLEEGEKWVIGPSEGGLGTFWWRWGDSERDLKEKEFWNDEWYEGRKNDDGGDREGDGREGVESEGENGFGLIMEIENQAERLIDANEQAAQSTSETGDKQLASINPDNAEEEHAPALAQPPEQNELTTIPDGEVQETSAPPPDDVPLKKTPSTQPERDETPPIEPRANGIEVRAAASNGADGNSEAKAATKLGTEEQDSQEAPAAPVQGSIQPSVGDDQPVAASTSLTEPVIEDHTPVSPVSRQDSLNVEEALEDRRKRKRRSVTPPPSAESVQKKAKIEDARPHVKLPEDESMTDPVVPSSTDVPISNATPAQGTTAVEDLAMENQPQTQDEEAPSPSENAGSSASPTRLPAPTQEDRNEPQAEVESSSRKQSSENESPTSLNESVEPPAEASAKTSTSDARFKNLLPVSSRRESSPKRHTTILEAEDRIVSPALHPATTALYIRDILRPLHVENLKDHLISLAAPSKTEPDPAIIEDFFLDSIRTHCFVRFSTTAAASRVRTGLHDRVWPDEKNRKPLWVDFVPEERLPQWFEVENASSGRGQAAKRWEVVYETEDDGVKAYLQEVGSHAGGGLRKAQPVAPPPENGAGIRGAPVGPRPRERDQDDVQSKPQPDRGRGFQALDDLFKSTTAKPKLYYLPVPQRTADKRLDLLAEGRGGGRNDELRRYSFEEGIIVDRGPEFGARGRGRFGARGGSYRGYASRGGGFRDEYRSDHRSDYRGDHRGDYRPDYRRERR
ncbi:MAG: hypothetical protein Q9203_000504 [Teloschistes exilis]